MPGNILLVGQDRAHAEVLADELGRIGALYAAPVAAEALVAALGADAADVDAVVVAPDVVHPVAVAQRVARASRDVPVLLLTTEAGRAAVERDLRFAPYLGVETRCLSADDPTRLAQEVGPAVIRRRRRDGHRRVMAAARGRLAAPETGVQQAVTQLGHLLEHAPVGVLVLDQEGGVASVNRFAAELLGFVASDAVGRSLSEVAGAAAARALRRVPAAPTAGERATEVVDAEVGGSTRHLEVTASAYETPLREPRTLLVLVDVTARVEHERARDRATERLRRLQALTDAALSHLGLDDLLKELLDRICGILGVDSAAILLLDATGEMLHVRAARGGELGVRQGTRIPVDAALAGRAAVERRPVLRADLADPAPDALAPQAAAVLAVPLTVRGRPLGVVQVGSRVERGFDEEDRQLLALVAERAALAIEQARAYEREHHIAETLQRSLLPDHVPAVAGLRTAARYLPSAESQVGGDWYDTVALPEGHLLAVIGDVVGRGIPAASLMGQLRSAVRAYAVEGHGPAAILHLVERFVDRLLPEASATLAVVCVTPGTGEVRVARAGHLPPLIVRPGAGGRLVEGGTNPPLGAMGTRTIVEAEDRLGAGESLLLCTDGLVERRGESLAVGLDRLRDAACAGPSEPDALCDHVLRWLVGERVGEDDVALVVLRRTEAVARLERTIAAEPRALAALRGDVRTWLLDHEVTSDALHALVLASDEACANAILHGCAGDPAATVGLIAERADDDVVIHVRDPGTWRPGPRPDGGRGLPLMRALADEVVVDTGTAGTTVTLRRRVV